jgi:guanylate kinase
VKCATDYTIKWDPKDHENRQIPLPDEGLQILANLQSQSPVGTGYIFISPQRLETIKQRIAKRKWDSISTTINNVLRDFGKIRKKATDAFYDFVNISNLSLDKSFYKII